MKRFFIISLILTATLSCSEEVSDLTLDQGYDFLPLQVGNFWTYQVEETVYEVFEPVTTTYILKEVIVDSLVAGDGTVKYLINRYIGNTEVELALDSVWAVRKTGRDAVFSENNTDLVKLVFPVSVNKTWDGNAYNTRESQEYYYESVDSYSLGDVSYTSSDAIRVIIEDIEQNLVNQDERSEVYLRNVGLVEKDYIQLSFCTVNCTQKGSEVGAIEKGRILSQKLIVYGKE
ncbi:hypothetical protein [Marinoscillum pacificum]|uniref:hypothetical protein n=1 Tax=Marinoscillum pacificum TaxID=392723 RepID=UPI0021579375|nr:hypothetical protein [Marinoscillum pacificum]